MGSGNEGERALKSIELVELGLLRRHKFGVGEKKPSEDQENSSISGSDSWSDGAVDNKLFGGEEEEQGRTIQKTSKKHDAYKQGAEYSTKVVKLENERCQDDCIGCVVSGTDWQGEAEREEIIRGILSEQEVDIEALRQAVWERGLPEGRLRASGWRVLCGYVGSIRRQWETTLARRREEYWLLVDRFMSKPGISSREDEEESTKEKDVDHPLSVAQDSEWRLYFVDSELREDIKKDVTRTYPGYVRFEKHKGLREALSRILFVWRKQKGGVLGYRQGMHELAALMLLVFAEGSPPGHFGDMEADAYWCFEYVMEIARPFFAEQSVVGEMGRLRALLRIKDPALEAHFEKLGVDVRFWGLRWMRLWLVREFDMDRAIQVWDNLLCAEDVRSWLRYMCVAICILYRDRLLQKDFGDCVKILLGGVKLDVGKVINFADSLRMKNVVYTNAAKATTVDCRKTIM